MKIAKPIENLKKQVKIQGHLTGFCYSLKKNYFGTLGKTHKPIT